MGLGNTRRLVPVRTLRVLYRVRSFFMFRFVTFSPLLSLLPLHCPISSVCLFRNCLAIVWRWRHADVVVSLIRCGVL